MKNYYIIIILLIIFLCLIIANYCCLVEKFTSDEYILPKKIFCYWNNYKDNKLIQAHVKNIKKNIPEGWTLYVLNDDNINEYVSKDFLDKYRNMEAFRFSDFLRLYLLQKYGGVWLDISTIIINGSFLDEYWEQMNKYKYDILLYEYKDKTLDQNIPYLENWFIMAPQNSKLVKDLYYNFNKAFEMGFSNYKKNILIPCGLNLSNTIRYDDDTYLMQHAIINYLHFNGNIYNINIKDAKESMFKIQIKTNWNHEKVIDHIMYNNKVKKMYAIKIVSDTRNKIKDIDAFINRLNEF